MRNSLIAPQKRITQGTIFCGVRSPYVEQESCYGISITARCDTARDFKAERLTFLTIVPIEDWLWFEELPKVIERQKKTASGNLRKKLIETKGTAVLLDLSGFEKALNSLDVKYSKDANSMNASYEDAKFAGNLSRRKFNDLPKSIAKLLSKEAQELIEGKKQEFYFLESVEATFGNASTNNCTGFVVLLRDVRSISRLLALKISEGIDVNDIEKIGKDDFLLKQFNINADFFALPISELKSPFIEQLMQKFSFLFGRIGTQDVSKSFSSNLNKLLGV